MNNLYNLRGQTSNVGHAKFELKGGIRQALTITLFFHLLLLFLWMEAPSTPPPLRKIQPIGLFQEVKELLPKDIPRVSLQDSPLFPLPWHDLDSYERSSDLD